MSPPPFCDACCRVPVHMRSILPLIILLASLGEIFSHNLLCFPRPCISQAVNDLDTAGVLSKVSSYF